MKTWTAAVALLFACTYGMAQSAQTAPMVRKACDDLKAEIAKKLDAKNVVGYSLDVVDKGKEGDAKVVGSCDGGTKSITYTRGGAASTASAAQPSDTKKSQ
jgi:Protein of unknown function (DUF1161)